MLDGKSFLLIYGVRGLSHEHAENLSDRIRKAGGNVVMPEQSKLLPLIFGFLSHPGEPRADI